MPATLLYSPPQAYALNFGDFGTFSPLSILSAPTFFPSLGHPYLGPNILCIHPQEELTVNKITRKKKRVMVLGRFIRSKIYLAVGWNLADHFAAFRSQLCSVSWDIIITELNLQILS